MPDFSEPHGYMFGFVGPETDCVTAFGTIGRKMEVNAKKIIKLDAAPRICSCLGQNAKVGRDGSPKPYYGYNHCTCPACKQRLLTNVKVLPSGKSSHSKLEYISLTATDCRIWLTCVG